MSLTLYGFPLSGHSHRAELMLRLLGLPFDARTVDLRAGEQKQPAFLALNPFGTVPVLADGDAVIADSVAILVYLATRYDARRQWLPTDAVWAAQVQRWLSVAQGPLYFGPASARLVTVFGRKLDHDAALRTAGSLFAVLDDHLADRQFLVGHGPTIADVALYSYVAHAPEGGVPLDPHGGIRAWLARVEALPGFQPMPASRAGLVA